MVRKAINFKYLGDNKCEYDTLLNHLLHHLKTGTYAIISLWPIHIISCMITGKKILILTL